MRRSARDTKELQVEARARLEARDGDTASVSPPRSAMTAFARDVIDRVMARADVAGDMRQAVDDRVIDEFCDTLLATDPRAPHAFVQQLEDAGIGPDVIYLDYFAPAARRLGQRWEEDTSSFFEVSLGSARLHALLNAQRDRFFGDRPTPLNGCTALFANVPDETHVLGVVMAADYFRRAGWQVDVDVAASLDGLVARARTQAYDVIGLTAGGRVMLGAMAETIDRLREVSPHSKMIVGGQLTQLEPDLARRVNADLTAGDPAVDPILLQGLVGRSLTA